jgi:hypothetical protein
MNEPMTKEEWMAWLEKTLNDETIKEIAKGHEGVYDGAVDYKGFARAIVRKAQEK